MGRDEPAGRSACQLAALTSALCSRRATAVETRSPLVRAGRRSGRPGGLADRPREPDEQNQRDEHPGRCQEDVVRREHESLLVDGAIEDVVGLLCVEAARLQAGERLPGGRARGSQLFDELLMMNGRPAIPQRRRERSAEGTGGDSGKVEEARRRRNSQY